MFRFRRTILKVMFWKSWCLFVILDKKLRFHKHNDENVTKNVQMLGWLMLNNLKSILQKALLIGRSLNP